MTPEISEFSYGFALTNELVGWSELNAAPIFPNLVEEGRAGGGYDVKLDFPAIPLFLQFKRADCMTRSSAKEIRKYGLPLSVPFYRFAITERKRSFQHTSLIALDDGSRFVFYVAPRFHTLAGINTAWNSQNVAGDSIFVAPSEIGEILDDESHHVSYDSSRAWFCSEPKSIAASSIDDIRTKALAWLDADQQSLRARLPQWREDIRQAKDRARRRQVEIQAIVEKQRADSTSADLPDSVLSSLGRVVRVSDERVDPQRIVTPSPRIQSRRARTLSAEEQLLRDIADEARAEFNTLLCIIQRP